MLEWAQSQEETITDEEVELQAVTTMPQIKRASSQLFAVLVSLVTPGTDGLELVRNVTKGNGMDAWRKLTKRYDPSGPTSRLALLKEILQPPKAPMATLMGAI